MKALFFIFTFLGLGYVSGYTQCDPAASLDCASAPVLCALDELDGYSCTSLSTNNPTGPNPLCNGSGTPQNTQWWSFLGNGHFITITITVDLSSCSNGRGIQAGIMRGCSGVTLDCTTNCNETTITLSAGTGSCTIYNLWIDGCESDICDYDIQLTNGRAFRLPEPLPPPSLLGSKCQGGVAEICTSFELCEGGELNWTVDGMSAPDFKNSYCMELEIPENENPIEICLTVSTGGAPDFCEQKTSCTTLIPDPIPTVDDGDIFVCFEEHERDGYYWRDDTLIYSSCIEPPCTYKRPNLENCIVKYTARIHLLEERAIKTIYELICGSEDLPYRTEDGQLFFDNACFEEITWKDREYYGCDTSYLFNLEVIDPSVSITQSCPLCSDSVWVYSVVKYENECTFGETSFISIWLNEDLDTIGVGDSILTSYKGKVSMRLLVNHINDYTGQPSFCTLNDTSWHLTLSHDALSILGDTLICDVDTSRFSLPDAYNDGCAVKWTIADVNGQIIFPISEDSSIIDIFWPEPNTKDGQICVQIINGCDSIIESCRSLKGCIITATSTSFSNSTIAYPNPAYDFLYIKGDDMDEMAIRMLNIKGDEISVQPKYNIDGVISINMKNITPGIYFIHMSRGDEFIVKKVLVGR